MKRVLMVAGCTAIAAMAAFAGTENGEDEIIKKDVEVGRLAYAAGYRYAHGKGVERDLEKAFKCYLAGAASGYVKAEAAVATCYWNGEGTERDYKAAAYWKEQAAIHGDAHSMFAMGIMRHFGLDGNKNCYEACQWFRLAAQNGCGDPSFEPGVIEEEGCGPKVSVKWIRSAAEAGNVDAIYWLAACYRCGSGVFPNRQKYYDLMVVAAERGNSLAKCILGCDKWYNSVSGSRNEGLEMVREAEKQGNVTAYVHLDKLDKTGKL